MDAGAPSALRRGRAGTQNDVEAPCPDGHLHSPESCLAVECVVGVHFVIWWL